MDLTAVTRYRRATTRADLLLAPGERVLAGGTWLFSEPNRDVTGLVDIMSMPWQPLEVTDAGLRIGATCTIARLLAEPQVAGWSAQPLFGDAANALLASFKIWNEATVVGNVCRAFAAAAMLAACATLDATAEIWGADGTIRHVPVASLPTGNGTNTLQPSDVIRAIDVPARALRGRTSLRKIALAELGRSGAVVTGRRDPDDAITVVVTAATLTPHVVSFPVPPAAERLTEAVRAATDFYTDALGSADWRRHVAGVLATRVLEDLMEAHA
ncbi:FAD binding domain-containing protein [Demequina capsici]|uniref:FAD binding domain-containing protein n=1 Tax=Demequina capsici TaxID=3075620 RepID=A0AA96F8J4_9MICO|nr:FAD binding domain-containing protein [Demequina sp. OYTSA14]WNM23690.1 FAD binding domain-containing protein [Demequina sp. OYTSA14]